VSIKRLVPLNVFSASSAPSGTHSTGDMYYNTSDGILYVHTGSAWAATGGGSSGGGGGASVVTDVTAPSSPADGDLWYNSTNGVLYIYYQDADSSQWVMTTSSVAPSGVSQSELDAVEALALLGL